MTVTSIARDDARNDKGANVFATLPFETAERVRHRLDATVEEMAGYIGLPLRTYQRRAKDGLLKDAESAKIEMFDSLLDLGSRVLGSDAEARLWLTSPILSLGGERPIELLDTVRGYERVKNKLLQIEYGTY